MNYIGTIIEESLSDKSVLMDVKVTKTEVERVEESHQTPWLKQWTLHTIEVPENTASAYAEKLSHCLEEEHNSSWYIDFKNDQFHFIIFSNKVFKVNRKINEEYDQVKAYGIKLGIPEHQLDFI